MKQYCETNGDINMSLLQIITTQISPRLLSPVTLLFKRSLKGMVLIFRDTSIGYNNNENNPHALINIQSQTGKDINTYETIPLLPTGSTVAVQ